MQNFWKETNVKAAEKSNKIKTTPEKRGECLRIAVHEKICRCHSQT